MPIALSTVGGAINQQYVIHHSNYRRRRRVHGGAGKINTVNVCTCMCRCTFNIYIFGDIRSVGAFGSCSRIVSKLRINEVTLLVGFQVTLVYKSLTNVKYEHFLNITEPVFG